MSLKEAIKINGAKYRSFQKPDGKWSDPLEQHNFWSRTFLPKGTKFIEGQEVSEMITKIKADKTISFKEADLSPETKAELDKEKIPYEKTGDDNHIGNNPK